MEIIIAWIFYIFNNQKGAAFATATPYPLHQP